MKTKLKNTLFIFVIIILIISLFAGCKEEKCQDIITQKGLTQENLSEWTMEIVYISETRGTGDKIYSVLSGDSNDFIAILNAVYAANNAEKPSYIFSAEAMCEYKIDFYHLDKENPELTFYYLQGSGHNLLTYVTKRTEDEDVYIDYSFFTPYGDLPTLLSSHREMAIEPEDELAITFVSRTEMMSTIMDFELEYEVPEFELEDNERDNTDISFEFYEGELPDDKSTNSQLYSNRTVGGLASDQYLLTARVTNERGISEEWSISEVRYNEYYTLVIISYPQFEILDSLGLSPSSAITIPKDELPLTRWIVFIDEKDNVLDVIDPSIELH